MVQRPRSCYGFERVQSRRGLFSSSNRKGLADQVGGIDPSTILLLSDTTFEQGKMISAEEFSMGHH